MLEKYNCQGCHVIENWGGDLLRRYKEKTDGPPVLIGEGEKVQPEWFFGFLSNVVVLRPWLKVRMPSFQMPGEDAAALVDYFAALDGKLRPYTHFDRASVKPEVLAEGRKLFQMAECLSCHGAWPPPPGQEPPTAPNLLFTKHRLRPDWIFKWIVNPPKIRPGTKMPVFFQNAGVVVQVLRGSRGEQEGGRWSYVLEAGSEPEFPEGQIVTLRLGGQEFPARVKGVEGKRITLIGLRDLGATIGKAELENHGEPLDPEILGGDAYRQIGALRDYLMIEENFGPAPQKGAPARPPSPAPRAGGAPPGKRS